MAQLVEIGAVFFKSASKKTFEDLRTGDANQHGPRPPSFQVF